MTKIVLIGSSGNAAVRPNRFPFFTFQYVFGFELQKQNVSFPFAPFGLPSKCKKGNDNYTFVTTYYSNFGELIALMRPSNRLNGSMLLSMNVRICFHVYFVIVVFKEHLRCFHAYQSFHSFCALYFCSFDRFPFRTVHNSLSLKTKRMNLILCCLQVLYCEASNIWSANSLTCCWPVSIVVYL